MHLIYKYFGGISGVYQRHIWGISPSLLSPNRGYVIRERGIPERINRTALGAMMAGDPLHNAIMSLLCCFRGVALRPRPVGSDQRGLGRKTWGADPRAATDRAFPHQTATRVPAPPCQIRSG